ncbi:alpha/beta fold hydrolase [Micromonospora trifolii]|uniref:alpha/beta fold hydrolase n=1 Tax=Micromonospora trifolii TaxID=2911208 RepID=UPI003CF60353
MTSPELEVKSPRETAILSTVDRGVHGDDGCRLWAEQAGTGAPLVLCHGGPGLWDYLAPVARLLEAHARTIRWDQRGCGRSQRRGPYGIARSVADLDAVRDQLAGPRTALLSHSWGAHLALRYAIEHPEPGQPSDLRVRDPHRRRSRLAPALQAESAAAARASSGPVGGAWRAGPHAGRGT